MLIINKISAMLTLTIMLFITTFASSTAYALQIPGLRPSGAPACQIGVNFHLTSGNGKMSIATHAPIGFFCDDGSVVLGIDGRYSLRAYFDESGNLLGGTLSFIGTIPGLGINDKRLLMTANLEAFGFDPLQPNLIGFNTKDIVCDPTFDSFAHCLTNESVYIFLDTEFLGLDTSLKTIGQSIITTGNEN